MEISSFFRSCIPLYQPLQPACSPDLSEHTDLPLPTPSSGLAPGSLHKVPGVPKGPAGNCGRGSRSLPDLTGHLTARTVDGHALPLGELAKIISLSFILPSDQVSFPALIQLNRRLHPWWCAPVNSFKFHTCIRTPQVADLTSSLWHCIGSWPMQHLVRIVYGQD